MGEKAGVVSWCPRGIGWDESSYCAPRDADQQDKPLPTVGGCAEFVGVRYRCALSLALLVFAPAGALLRRKRPELPVGYEPSDRLCGGIEHLLAFLGARRPRVADRPVRGPRLER